MRKNKLRIQVTPELLQAGAAREAPRIAANGWRPSRHDLAQLKASTATRARIARSLKLGDEPAFGFQQFKNSQAERLPIGTRRSDNSPQHK